MKILSKITDYNGIEMRSKLEAKYAELFDSLNIEWAYEAEGYKFLDGTCYLPDFYLPYVNVFWDNCFGGFSDSSKPALGAYFEAKGIMSAEDLHKIEMLSTESGKPVIIGYSSGKIEICINGKVTDTYRLQLCGVCGNLFLQNPDEAITVESTCYCGRYGDDIILCGKSIFTSFKPNMVYNFEWTENAKSLIKRLSGRKIIYEPEKHYIVIND